jgi:hypothetical protein
MVRFLVGMVLISGEAVMSFLPVGSGAACDLGAGVLVNQRLGSRNPMSDSMIHTSTGDES